MAGAEYETVACVKNEVFVYKIPARTSNRGYRAADWTLDKPDWTGRMKLIVKGKAVAIHLEDRTTGELFAKCPLEEYPTNAVEQVVDSSRYFVIRIQDGSGRGAFIGIGFADRADSFDLLVGIQDHFKWVKREETQAVEAAEAETQVGTAPKLDLGFKEGQTIKLNISTRRRGDGEEEGEEGAAMSNKSRPKARMGGTPGLLPPPPGGVIKLAGPPRNPSAVAATSSPVHQRLATIPPASNQSQPTRQAGDGAASNVDLLVDFGMSSSGMRQPLVAGAPVPSAPVPSAPVPSVPVLQPAISSSKQATAADSFGDFGEFTSAGSVGDSSVSGAASSGSSGGWVNFE